MSLDAYLKELQEATSGGDGMTTREIARKLGMKPETVKERILYPAQDQGRLVRTKKWVENIAGQRQEVPAYKIIKAAK